MCSPSERKRHFGRWVSATDDNKVRRLNNDLFKAFLTSLVPVSSHDLHIFSHSLDFRRVKFPQIVGPIPALVQSGNILFQFSTEVILALQETSGAQDNSHPRPSTRFTFWSHGGMLLVQNSVLKYALRRLLPFYCCHRYHAHTSMESSKHPHVP